MSVAYFAYGANMAQAIMDQHCPGNVAVGIAELRQHRFAFSRRSVRTGTGVSDVVADTARSVWGVLYEVEDLAALDAKEGAGWAYDRCEVTVFVDGRARDAITYKVKRPEPHPVAPSDEYIDGILDAARLRGLPGTYIEELLRARAEGVSSSRPPS
jgi:gamma-glutamylcyclotransferase (GGCT)/AIG2-like uncharacterized protein YtfP